MKLKETQLNCQIPCLERLGEGNAKVPPQSLTRRIKLTVRRLLGPNRERAFKNYSNDRMNRFCELTGRGKKPSTSLAKQPANNLQAGDWIKVRSIEEIEANLNHWNQVKGCTFMPEMSKYCGTVQRVLKPMRTFVDERDLRVKKSRGIILLEGVLCQGTADFGSCDRACYHFWREEWLQKIEEVQDLKPDLPPESMLEGDWVRVRPLEEIKATISHTNQLNGCTFMPEMAQYCGTTQRVLKPMNRFVDERDFRVKMASGILLLDGIVCQGVADFGSCDRTCFYLWREEWLQKAL